MSLLNLLADAKSEIILFGVLPLADDLLEDADGIGKLLDEAPGLKLTILYESETDLFNKSLILNSEAVSNPISFIELKNKVNRVKTIEKYLYQYSKGSKKKQEEFKAKDSPHRVFQINLQHPFYAIIVDKKVYCCLQFIGLSRLEDFKVVELADPMHQRIRELISFYIDPRRGGIYLSMPDTPPDRMLVMYDKDDTPRGIYPRAAFYNTDFQRYSVWLLIFNRKGELLLHQRSEKASDNANLWDKSAGGHVDIKDRSSAHTAEKELIEELFMTKAEYTKHVGVDTSKMVNLGEWSPEKRNNDFALNVFDYFDDDDFGYFYIKEPCRRTSKRRFIDSETGSPYLKETKFISDIFLFISPATELQSKDDLKDLSSYAGKDHKLVSVQELKAWISDTKRNNKADSLFTDDLLFIMESYEDQLIQFSDFVSTHFSEA